MFIYVQTPPCAWVPCPCVNACEASKWTSVFSSEPSTLCIKAGSLMCTQGLPVPASLASQLMLEIPFLPPMLRFQVGLHTCLAFTRVLGI